MPQTNPHPRLHMGCGEALRSDWLFNSVRPEHKPARITVRKPAGSKPKNLQGRSRG